MSELHGAKVSRGRLKGSAEKKIHVLRESYTRINKIDTGQVTLDQTSELQTKLVEAKEAFDRYTAAIDRCLTLEGKEHDPGDEHMVEQGDMEDNLAKLNYKIQALKARVQEEKSARARAEANAHGRTHDQPGNVGRLVAKPPPPMEKGITLDELETWSSTWEDYYKVTKLEKEVPDLQRANFKSHLSQEMRSVVEHVLGIGSESTKTCAEILKAIKGHIRSNRNIQIDKVAFEKRTQKQGESFDDYLVAIKKMSRNADLCKVCLDDRLLTKIMAGLMDQEAREELLARVPTPKLEEAISFARSKEAARRSNMDLNGRVVQQIRGRDRIRSRSESPGGYRRESPKSFRRDQSLGRLRQSTTGAICYFCGKDGCFSRDDHGKCPAYRQQCRQCGGQDHFQGTVACQRRFSSRRGRRDQSRTRTGRAVQVRGLSSTRKAPKARINVKTLDGRNQMGSLMFHPDSAADCTIMGKHRLREFNVQPQDLEPPDEEGVDAANKSSFKMVGRIKVTFEYHGREVPDEIHVVEEKTELLVSWDTCIGLGILHKEFPEPIFKEPPGARAIAAKEDKSGVDKDTKHLVVAEKLMAMVGDKENPSESDRERVKAKILEEYKDVFSVDKELKPMNCTPMSIHLKPGAVPYCMSAPRKIGPSLKPPSKKELDDMVKKAVIEPVSADYVTEWCAPFCPREKESGGIRPTVDFTKLNDWVQRAAHPVTTPYEAVHSVAPGSRWFSVMDAKNGYHQIMLDKEAQDLLCFITPWGRYKFLRGPQGFIGTGDKHNYEGDRILSGVQDTSKVVDDIITANITFPEHMERVIEVLQRCREGGITLSPNKFKFAETEVKYVGYIVGREGIKADPAKLKAIQDYPKPSNIHELRSFDGMINQIGHFTTELTEARGVIRDLRSKKNVFTWGKEHDKAFEAIKACLTRLITLVQFDPKLPTRLDTDGSKLKGLGYTLFQEHGKSCACKCPEVVWKSIQCGSRFLTETEGRYAPIEFEALGVTWAVKKCHYFLAGLPEFLIRNDHRTLIPILNNYSLNDIENPRVRRLVEKLRPYK